MVAFGRNGFIQIAYTQSNANAAFAFVVVLCINRPLSAGFDCILYSSSWALKLHPCTLTYIEIHTFLFSRKKFVKFCVNTAVYTRSWNMVTLFQRIYCSVCMPHAISPAIYNSFSPSFEPRRAKLGKTFAGEPETVRVWQKKLSHHALVCRGLAKNLRWRYGLRLLWSCCGLLERSTYRGAFWLCRQVTACKIISAVLIGPNLKKSLFFIVLIWMIDKNAKYTLKNRFTECDQRGWC